MYSHTSRSWAGRSHMPPTPTKAPQPLTLNELILCGELRELEAQLAASAPKWPDDVELPLATRAALHAETQADCLHLEVTLANVRASATASDAAIYQALQQSERARCATRAHALTRLELERPAADDDDDARPTRPPRPPPPRPPPPPRRPPRRPPPRRRRRASW